MALQIVVGIGLMVWSWGATAEPWTLVQTFDDPTVASPATDFFGWSVALDGSNLLIGAPGDNTTGRGVGQVHLFSPSASPSPVPVPATVLLFASALTGLVAVGWTKCKVIHPVGRGPI